MRGSRGRDRIEGGFTDAISDYYHYCCELESRSGIGILDTTLCNKDYQCLAQVDGFLRILQFPLK